MLNNDSLINGESPINETLLPIAVLCVVIYFVMIVLTFNPVTIFNKIIQQIQIRKLVLISICIISLSLLIKYYFPVAGFLLLDFLSNIVTQAIKEPLAFFFSHFFYFGIVFILPFIYYKYQKQIFEKIGLGAILVILFHLLLMACSETRAFLGLFPVLIIFSGLLLKDYFVVNNKTIIIMGILSLLMSTIWLPINQIIPYKRLDSIGITYLYAIHHGPWMPAGFYYYVLLPACLSIMLTLKIVLKPKNQEI